MSFWKGAPNEIIEMQEFEKDRVVMRPINSNVARDIIVKNHYSHTWPVAVLCLGFYIDDKLNGIIVYGSSATSHMANSLPSPNYWELQRLYSFDWAGKNIESFMIGKSIRYIKENHKEIDCLISFADPEQGHAGTIYQATNWIYCGLSDIPGGYQYKFKDKWEHMRSTGARLGTRDHSIILEMYPNIEYRKGIRKHRYIYLLPNDKKHKKELMQKLNDKYETLPYPKANETKE
jgi:hypothetical protein